MSFRSYSHTSALLLCTTSVVGWSEALQKKGLELQSPSWNIHWGRARGVGCWIILDMIESSSSMTPHQLLSSHIQLQLQKVRLVDFSMFDRMRRWLRTIEDRRDRQQR